MVTSFYIFKDIKSILYVRDENYTNHITKMMISPIMIICQRAIQLRVFLEPGNLGES